jgi:hypothetical protein
LKAISHSLLLSSTSPFPSTLSKVLDLSQVHVFPSAEFKERRALQEAYLNEVATAASQGLPLPPQPAALQTPLPTPQERGISEESVIEGKLVELIRLCRVDAKIDASKQQIVIQSEQPSIYQQIIDKTKSISYRSTQLISVIDKKVQQRNQVAESNE